MTDTTMETQNARARWGNWMKFFQFRSIESRLILNMLVAGLIPLILMAGAIYFVSRAVLGDSIQNEVDSVANLTEDQVERWLSTRSIDAATYSSIILSERGQIPVMQDILESTDQTYEAIYFTTRDGVVQFGVRQEFDVATGEARFNTEYQVRHNFREDGTLLFTNLTQEGRTGVIQYAPFSTEGNEVKTMFFYHEVLDGGAVRGYIFLQVSSVELQNLAARFSDGDGTAFIQIGDYVVSNISIDPLDEEIELVQKAKAETSGVDTLEGFLETNAVAAWRGNSELGFVVYAQIPQSKAQSPILSLVLILVLLVAISVVFMGLIALYFSRRFTRPIRELTKAMQDFTRGATDTPIDHLTESPNAFGDLARAFADMKGTVNVQVYEATENRQYLEEVLTSYMKFVERVSRGDLTSRLSLNGQTGNNLIVANVRVEQDDNLLRLGYNLNRMVEALHSMASQTRDVARSLSEAAVQILESSTQQISAATQQDAAVSQTTSTVQEVRATVAETAERAQMVAEAAQQSVEISRQGQHAVAETIEGMNVIRSRVESIAENILMLSERTTQIGDIIATVNAIADQSKMLALNASIEAARAGEEGRGFAVVAMEVRNLAEQSREATAQVRDILSEIQQATNTAVMVTEEGTKGVDLGVQLVDRAGRAIRELAGKLEEASQAAMQIAASTRQQSQGMDQLTSSMTSIKATSSTTATIMQASQRNAKDLNEMARQMESAISAYKL